jgi:UDP-3-O-[3-hydroxymyristoyl] glucosamine N-acyltransferase
MKYTEQERLEYAKNTKEDFPKNDIHFSVRFGDNCSIGRDGFGWIRQEDGTLYKMPHRGNVVIHEKVTIGSNVCIDRAVNGSTEIGSGTKIDNLVHIAHGAKIGKNCLIVAGSVIGGSAEIGDNCFIGINASIKNKVKIGNNVIIGMGAVVVHDVPDGSIMVGNPARMMDRKFIEVTSMNGNDDLAK